MKISHSILNLTAHQEAIWLESLLYPDAPLHNIGAFLEFDDTPDFERLQAAIQRTVDENDALRVVFSTKNSRLVQEFLPAKSIHLQIDPFKKTLSSEKAMQYMQEKFRVPIALDDPQLIQFEYLSIENSRSILFLRAHHLILDGWGRALLLKKIAANYNTDELNRPLKTEASFAAWVEDQNKRSIEPSVFDYWKQKFADFEYTPLFHKRIGAEQHLGARDHFVANRSVLDNFKKRGNPFHLLLAAFIFTLAKTTGKKDFCIGIPVLNRSTEAAKNTIGCCVGLIPLRVRYNPASNLEQLIGWIEEEMRESIPYRQASIQEIGRAVKQNTDNNSPLFDAVFSFADHDYSASFDAISTTNFGTFYHETAVLPLIVHVQSTPNPAHFQCTFDYQKGCFAPSEITAFKTHFGNALATLCQHPTEKLQHLPFLSSIERENILRVGTGETIAFGARHLVDRILEMSNNFPDLIIASDENEDLTYAELSAASEKTAALLQSKGFKPGQGVALHFGRTVDYLIGVLGVLRAGGFFVPLDPEIPTKRKFEMLEQAQIDWLLEGRITPFDTHQWKGTLVKSGETPKGPFSYVKRSPDDFAYAIFTSGTTGQPKAVPISYRSLENILAFFHHEVLSKFDGPTNLSLVSATQFDASMLPLFGSLCHGNPLKIVPENVRKDGRLLADFLTKHRVLVCDGIPSILHAMFLRTPSKPEGFDVQHYYIGGEPFSPALARQLFTWHNDDVHVTNAYGPTETTVNSTFHTFNRTTILDFAEIPIGLPVFNTVIRILDSEGKLLPIGARGEICIGGAGLSSGYIGAPELTKSKFKLNAVLDEMLYHTGDIGRMDSEGRVYCYGRQDHQLKIRGYRIEPREIEGNITQIPSIEDAVVMIRTTKQGAALVAVVKSQEMWDAKKLRKELTHSLPQYMIPTFVVSQTAIPLTASGKRDDAALKKSVERLNLEVSQQPETPTEHKLAEIMGSILNLDEIDVTGSFFSQGGDSLGLVYFLAEVEAHWDLTLSVSAFAAMHNIQEMAAFLDSKILTPEVPLKLDALFPVLPSYQLPEDGQASTGITFLTGATGFVGAYLLRELLKTHSKVYCLIRAQNESEGKLRLHDRFASHELSADLSRVQVVCGDLSLPKCGIETAQLLEIQENCDSIYHCGANVNFLMDYQSLSDSNVASTEFLLSLCTKNRLKSFQYISTLSVFVDPKGTFSEADASTSQLHFNSKGYRASKWASEYLVMHARSQGIPCTIHRLGRITAALNHPNPSRSDFFHRIVDGCLQLEKIPESALAHEFDLTPVDLAAKSIAALAKTNKNRNFHIAHPKKTRFEAFVEQVRNAKNSLEIVSYEGWLEAISAQNKQQTDRPFYLIVPILKQKTWISVDRSTFMQTETMQQLNALGIKWPEIDELWQKYIQDSKENSKVKRLNNNQ